MALEQNEILKNHLVALHQYTNNLSIHTQAITEKVKVAEAKEAAENEKRAKEWADAANLQRLAKIKQENAREANNVVKEIVIHNPDDAGDRLDSADLVNDYLMKQINNDARNHLRPKDYIE